MGRPWVQAWARAAKRHTEIRARSLGPGNRAVKGVAVDLLGSVGLALATTPETVKRAVADRGIAGGTGAPKVLRVEVGMDKRM